VIRQLCEEGCHLIALPEMVMHEKTLATLKDVVREHGAQSSLALVLAGTCRVERPDGKPPYNEAVVLDHTGAEILRQRKLSRWNLDAGQCERYDFELPVGEDRLREFISPGEELVVLEQPHLGRLAVLVCEDLGRSEPGRWIRANLLLDLQFMPVLDGSLNPERWNTKAAGEAAVAGRCRVVVANSLPLTLRQNRVNAKTKPDWVVQQCGIGLGIDLKPGNPPGGGQCALMYVPLGGTAGQTTTLEL
jgi:predicted amidohydrolase